MYELRFYRMLSHECACTSLAISWEPTPRGCANAVDLVRLIRKEHGDHYYIGVAGFPGIFVFGCYAYDYYEEQYFYFYVYCFSDTYLT